MRLDPRAKLAAITRKAGGLAAKLMWPFRSLSLAHFRATRAAVPRVNPPSARSCTGTGASKVQILSRACMCVCFVFMCVRVCHFQTHLLSSIFSSTHTHTHAHNLSLLTQFDSILCRFCEIEGRIRTLDGTRHRHMATVGALSRSTAPPPPVRLIDRLRYGFVRRELPG